MLGIINGKVYDPRNNVDGVIKEIWIRDGKVVSAGDVDQSKAEVIDAAGLIIMPGGVDIHSHIAGGKVNAGRKLRPDDSRGHERKRMQPPQSGGLPGRGPDFRSHQHLRRRIVMWKWAILR